MKVIVLPIQTILHTDFSLLNSKIDWNMVDTISSVAMALFTIAAIFIAIYIPQKERITSAKINLFNYRFNVYHFIVTHFSEAFEKGKTNFNDDELMRQGMISDFLLSKEDNKELSSICAAINEKINNKYANDNIADESISIENEISLIDKVFDKYLNLRNYGVEKRM